MPSPHNGMTPLCVACGLGLAKVAVALLDACADISFATPVISGRYPGFTPCSGTTLLVISFIMYTSNVHRAPTRSHGEH
jgi:hypothetical protein